LEKSITYESVLNKIAIDSGEKLKSYYTLLLLYIKKLLHFLIKYNILLLRQVHNVSVYD
jgi:hypothetical protein